MTRWLCEAVLLVFAVNGALTLAGGSPAAAALWSLVVCGVFVSVVGWSE